MPRLPRALLVIAVLAALVLLPAVLADAGGPLLADVKGPGALAPAQAATYNLTITGGPAAPVNYTISWFIEGANTTGGAPQKASPSRSVGNKTRWALNVTAPTREGSITLVVNVSAAQDGGLTENTTTSYPITVVKAIVLTATFHNGSNTAALNVTVRWYVDNALVGTTTIKEIAPNADGTATFDYLPIGLSQGEHTVTVTADLDHDGVINPNRGEVSTSSLFYNQAAPPATGWIVLLGMGIFIPVFLGVVAMRRRGQS